MKRTDRQIETLIAAARKAQTQAKALFSHFPVGAALLTTNGEIFTGCNIESSSFGLTICAERCALFKALSQGCQKGQFLLLVVVSSSNQPAPPCGACRQALWDWAPELEIITVSAAGNSKQFFLRELFPHPFDGDFLL